MLVFITLSFGYRQNQPHALINYYYYYYIIYANDFSRASELLFTIMFADDISVFIEGQSCGNVCQLLNEELEKCDIWIKANKLTLNLKKNTFHDFP